MKGFKKLTLGLLCTLCSLMCYSQSNDAPQFLYSGHEFSKTVDSIISSRNTLQAYVANHLTKNFTRLDSVCYEGISMVRFKLKKGKISELACTLNTPKSIASVLSDYVMQSEKYWTGSCRNGEFIVLPVHYAFIFNCDKKKILNTTDNRFVFSFDRKMYPISNNYIFLEGIYWQSGVADF